MPILQHKNKQNMAIFRAKIADNLPLKRLLVFFFMLKVVSHVAVDGYEICFAI